MKTGFMVFNQDWTLEGEKYDVGNTYEKDTRAFRLYEAEECLDHLENFSEDKIAKVSAIGGVVRVDNECLTDEIHIICEITLEDLLETVNRGEGNTGRHNNGENNTGNYNVGNRNAGNHNHGDDNTGDSNIGSNNAGNHNKGNGNAGCWNAGDNNAGSFNRGSNCEGSFNLIDNETGWFNTEERNGKVYESVRIFDKESGLTEEQWKETSAYKLLDGLRYAQNERVSDEEMEIYSKFPQRYNMKEICTEWHSFRETCEQAILKTIPNFDAEKFEKITGIVVDIEED